MIRMKKEYRYQFIIDGEVKDQITEDSKESLIKCINVMKWEDD